MIRNYSMHFDRDSFHRIQQTKSTNERDHISSLTPHITGDSIYDNYRSWSSINGCYSASGGEQYLYIGNFKTESESDFKFVLNQPPYTLGIDTFNTNYSAIDDVHVSQLEYFDEKGDVTLCQKKDSVFDLKTLCPLCTFQKENGDTVSVFNAIDTGVFKMRAFFKKCAFTKDFTIKVSDCTDYNVFVPNAFSPNDDGNNDEFDISLNPVFEFQKVKIYDRWGRMMFESNNPNTRWQGTFKGQPAMLGVYMYQLWYKDKRKRTDETKVGDFTLVR